MGVTWLTLLWGATLLGAEPGDGARSCLARGERGTARVTMTTRECFGSGLPQMIELSWSPGGGAQSGVFTPGVLKSRRGTKALSAADAKGRVRSLHEALDGADPVPSCVSTTQLRVRVEVTCELNGRTEAHSLDLDWSTECGDLEFPADGGEPTLRQGPRSTRAYRVHDWVLAP